MISLFNIFKKKKPITIEKAIPTSSAMWGLWDYEEYKTVVTYEDWHALFCENEAIKEQVSKAKFVPIYIHSDGCYQFKVKIDEPLSSREKQYVFMQSQEYLFESSGRAVLSGIEGINRMVSTSDGIIFDLSRGNYAVSICMVDWDKEPSMKLPNGAPSPDALPDFIVLVNSDVSVQGNYRQDIETFDRR